MFGQLCAKLISKTPRSVGANPWPIYSESLYSSSFSKTNAGLFRHQFSSQYSAVPWKFSRYNEVSGCIRNGFFSNSALLARRFSTHGISKAPRKISANGALSLFQARRNFYSLNSGSGGWSSVFRRFTADGMVIGLILANAAVFILWRVASPQFMVSNFMISVENFMSGRVHTLITAAFSHTDMWHLISNMVGLYFFGMSIGRSFGPEYLLKLYLSGALVGSLFFLIHHAFIDPSFQRKQMFGLDPSRVSGLGASGAVNAIMLLDIFLFPTKTLYFDFIIPVPAILLGVFLIGKDILRMVEGDPVISGSAHLGGATVAALAWALTRRGRFRRF